VYVGVFAGALAYIAYFGLLDAVGPIHGNLVFYAVPVVATVGGAGLLGESVSSSTLLGFVVIFAGFAVLAGDPLADAVATRIDRLVTLLGWHDESESRTA
jgi:drug/metabolite transporter (DMT)-like permease